MNEICEKSPTIAPFTVNNSLPLHSAAFNTMIIFKQDIFDLIYTINECFITSDSSFFSETFGHGGYPSPPVYSHPEE